MVRVLPNENYNTQAVWNVHHFWFFSMLTLIGTDVRTVWTTGVVWELMEMCFRIMFGSFWGEPLTRKFENLLADFLGLCTGWAFRQLILYRTPQQFNYSLI